MDDTTQEQYKQVIALQGKVVSWVGYDAESERYIILMSDNTAVSIDIGAFTIITNPNEVLKSALKEQELHAVQIMALKQKVAEQAYKQGFDDGSQGKCASDGEFDNPEHKQYYGLGHEAGVKHKSQQEEAKNAAGGNEAVPQGEAPAGA